MVSERFCSGMFESFRVLPRRHPAEGQEAREEKNDSGCLCSLESTGRVILETSSGLQFFQPIQVHADLIN